MSVLETPDALDDAAQALFEEARRRTHRRRIRRTIAAAILLGGAIAAAVLTLGGGSTDVYLQSATTPFADARGFEGHGELAFVSRGALWALDGASLRSVRLPAGLTPAKPILSPDGRWLAFLAAAADAPASQLWIARADGTGAHRVLAATVVEFVGWSPKADELAVTVDPAALGVKPGYDAPPSVLDVIAPGGRRTPLLRVAPSSGRIWSAVWSPDGTRVAASLVRAGRARYGTSIVAVPVSGGAARTWLTVGPNQPIPGLCARCYSPIAELAGWYPRWGIAFWSFAGGMVHNNDSTPLDVVAAPGARPRVLAETLSDGVNDVVAGGPEGRLALVANTNTEALGRELGQGKSVQRCSVATRTCANVPAASRWYGPAQPCRKPYAPCLTHRPVLGTTGSGVSLDPAWSPDGSLLAYVKAPFWPDEGNPAPYWYTAHRLDVWNPRTGVTREIAGVDGVSQPGWSRDGRSLLYVSGDGLWLAPATGGAATEIEHPLFIGLQLNGDGTMNVNYYGQIDWAGQFSWHST